MQTVSIMFDWFIIKWKEREEWNIDQDGFMAHVILTIIFRCH